MDIKDYGDLAPNSLDNVADFHETSHSPVRNVKSNGFANKEVVFLILTQAIEITLAFRSWTKRIFLIRLCTWTRGYLGQVMEVAEMFIIRVVYAHHCKQSHMFMK